jgi:hypothetical protein
MLTEGLVLLRAGPELWIKLRVARAMGLSKCVLAHTKARPHFTSQSSAPLQCAIATGCEALAFVLAAAQAGSTAETVRQASHA